ncbi:DUF5011 domain-containing protein, partial [Candidatus Giovannonibacteria bacterium]|nr:DUF5011 domain-containing protein [Candidatus Giovannonibacteria bacterium]
YDGSILRVNGDADLYGADLRLGTGSATTTLTSAAGFLGIASTSPWGLLSINPNGISGPEFVVGSSSATHFVVTNGGKTGIGTTSPLSLLTIDGRPASTSQQTVGLDEYLLFNLTGGGTQYGNQIYLDNAPTGVANTAVAQMMKIRDNTTLTNTVRGLEVQADVGSNTQGSSIAIGGFGRTFGVRAITTGDAGGVQLPAGLFAQTEGSTQGNAVRAYSTSITSADLVYLLQDTSAFTGSALRINTAATGGSFTGNLARFQVAGVNKFVVTAHGTTTIGDGSTQAGLQIGKGGLCVDNDGSCTASTTGRITAVSYNTANSDLAETYASNEELEPGDIVYTQGGLTVGKAAPKNKTAIIGVVSTKPGLELGFDDKQSAKNNYPIALVGRVPIKVSTEGGNIKPGDKIILSSLDGVGMAGGKGPIIGVALESFDGTNALSEEVVNQLMDNEPKSSPPPVAEEDTNPNATTDCYYSGGDALGRAKKDCKPLTSDNNADKNADITQSAEGADSTQIDNGPASESSTSDGKTVKIGKILVFVNLGYSDLGVDAGTEAWAVDQESGKVRSNYSLDMDGKDIINARNILSASGNWSIGDDGKLVVKEIQTEKLCIGSTCITETELKALLEKAGLAPTSPSEGGESQGVNDTEAPVVTVIGDNPATIYIGDAYSDNGASVTDNINENLGYKIKVDGTELTAGEKVQIDTSEAGTHTITFTATDQAGNTGTAERTVNVIEINQPESFPVSESSATSTPTL